MHIYFLGYPGGMGGANTECWHTAKVWRQHGIEVTFIPTWGSDQAMEDRLAAIGCKTVHVGSPDKLAAVPGFAGSVVVGMCNSHVMNCRGLLKHLGCKLAWVNCMTFMFDNELNAFRRHGPAEAYVFQSEFQRAELEKALLPLGHLHCQGHVIRGAFAFDEVPFAPRPHAPGEEFCIGRLARPDLDKWSSNHWPILARVPYAGRRALAMGWNPQTRRKCGQPPAWAEVLEPQKISVQEFLGRCHVMLGLNGGARENWPRIGLEAMAAGVPVVAQNQWGWREMITSGETGFLTDNDEEMCYRLAQLAYDEELRQRIVKQACAHVRDLACPERIGRQWRELFEKDEGGRMKREIPKNQIRRTKSEEPNPKNQTNLKSKIQMTKTHGLGGLRFSSFELGICFGAPGTPGRRIWNLEFPPPSAFDIMRDYLIYVACTAARRTPSYLARTACSTWPSTITPAADRRQRPPSIASRWTSGSSGTCTWRWPRSCGRIGPWPCSTTTWRSAPAI